MATLGVQRAALLIQHVSAYFVLRYLVAQKWKCVKKPSVALCGTHVLNYTCTALFSTMDGFEDRLSV